MHQQEREPAKKRKRTKIRCDLIRRRRITSCRARTSGVYGQRMRVCLAYGLHVFKQPPSLGGRECGECTQCTQCMSTWTRFTGTIKANVITCSIKEEHAIKTRRERGRETVTRERKTVAYLVDTIYPPNPTASNQSKPHCLFHVRLSPAGLSALCKQTAEQFHRDSGKDCLQA